MQTLLLLDLLSRGGGERLVDIKSPKYDFRKLRAPLVAQGLLEEPLRQETDGGKPKGQRLKRLELTDAAYEYLRDAENVRRLPQSKSCGPVAARLLAMVSAFMKANDVTVSELFRYPPLLLAGPGDGPEREPEPGGPVPDPEAFLRAISAIPAPDRMAGGSIRLSVVRRTFRNLRRADVDRLLMELQKRGAIVLYPFTSHIDITPEDREASLLVGGDDPRHFLFIR
jgi:hypothetical protein